MFERLRDERRDLADLVLEYTLTGRRAEDLANLGPAEVKALEDGVPGWTVGNQLQELRRKHSQLAPEQWVRLGQVLSLPKAADLSDAWPATVPRWFAALSENRQYWSDSPKHWAPTFEVGALESVGYRPPETDQIIAFTFLKLTTQDAWRFDAHLKQWEADLGGSGPRALARVVGQVIGDLPGLLAPLEAGQRARALRWIALYQEFCEALAGPLGQWALDRSKQVRDAALAAAARLPGKEHGELVAAGLEQANGPVLTSLAEAAAAMGEAGRRLLEEELAKGGPQRRRDVIGQVLGRVEATRTVSEVEPEIPPVAPEEFAPLAEDFVRKLGDAIDKSVENAKAAALEYPQAKWLRKRYAEAKGFSSRDAEPIRAWLDGESRVRPKALDWLPPLVLRGVIGSIKATALARLILVPDGKGGRRINRGDLSSGAGPISGADLRAVAAEVEKAGYKAAKGDIAAELGEIILTQGWYGKPYPAAGLWPLFAEHPELLEKALKPSTPGEPGLEALRILRGMPVPPSRLTPVLAKLALGGSKALRAQAQAVLAKRPEAGSIAVGGLEASKSEMRAEAARWIAAIGGQAGLPALRAALKSERSEPVQAAILAALAALGDDVADYLTPAALAAAAEKGLAKKPPVGMKWLPLDALPACRWASGDPVDPAIIRWWAVLAVKMKDPAGGGLFKLYLSLLDQPSREALGVFALEAWVAQDIATPSDQEAREYAAANVDAVYQGRQAEAKQYPDSEWAQTMGRMTRDQVYEELRRLKAGEFLGSAIGEKGLLALTCFAPGHRVLAAGQAYIRAYPKRRAQIEALVRAASENPDPAAIQFVLSIARKFKQATVRAVAAELSEEIAQSRGWSMDDLADRTIQTAGFEDDGVLRLDYGSRVFTGRIGRSAKTGAFAVQLSNPAGKPVAALPKAAAADSEELVQEAKAQLSASKKELKQVVALQTTRLHEAMCVGRAWDASTWLESLAGHPVMRQLVSALVWSHIPESGAAPRLFRPTPEGDFLDANDADLSIPPAGEIRLAHRAVVTADEARQWRTHLADYAVKPLFDQFTEPPPDLPDPASLPEGEAEVATRRGWFSDSFAIRGRAVKRGYTRGLAEDGGWFNTYSKEFPSAQITAIIEFTGSVLPEEQVPAALDKLIFARDGAALALAAVPPVLLAEAYGDYAYVAEAGQFDKDWENKSGF
ncbi:MAG: DUF4132 domain-containing protein [Bifidobacteriaceae bacterium]|nr:DUF4132 domain-containing protein [Bifidobacteriaceae bacterium]